MALNTSPDTPRFQSTLSVRRATVVLVAFVLQGDISIHALREESDRRTGHRMSRTEISIHALREESDPMNVTTRAWAYIFQSTLSVRRATLPCFLPFGPVDISIHALREESDALSVPSAALLRHFNPRSP